MAFTSLSHHIDLDWLSHAFSKVRKDAAPGVDGQTAQEYQEDLESNLQSLLDRAKSGLYRAPAVRRVHIPKGDGRKTRPIGIPTLEDKVLQRAVSMLLTPIYEQDFLDCSWGCRPKRDIHGALDMLRQKVTSMGGCWILEVDIRGYFDALDKAHLREFLGQRVRDGVVTRLIGKWMNAGVLDQGQLSYPKSGVPQGGVISPLLANIYLHAVLDKWYVEEVEPKLRARSFLVRYVDDFVLGFAREEDALAVRSALERRLSQYGLTVNREKTRLLHFRPPHRREPTRQGGGPRSFDFLGFTHHWARSRRGAWVVKVQTAKDRLALAVRKIFRWCRQHRHDPVRVQHTTLGRKLVGHYEAYGRRGNSRALSSFHMQTERAWHKWLNRRNRERSLPWAVFDRMLDQYSLPRARLRRSVRLAANPMT